jgi:phage-related protein
MLPAPAETETFFLVDVAGIERSLNGDTLLALLVGVQGRWMPPTRLTVDRSPGRAGGVLRGVSVEPREFELPLLLQAESQDQARRMMAQLLGWVDPMIGDCRFRVRYGADSRDLICRYVTGLEGDESPERHGAGWYMVAITLLAVEPYYQDGAAISVDYVTSAVTPTEFFPILPLVLNESTVFASPVVVQDGDTDAYPIWQIRGPGTALTLRNLTTGKYLTLSTGLLAGDVIAINTDTKAVTNQAGTNLYSDLIPGSSLWPLIRGANALQIELPNATAESRVTLGYTRRWRAPVPI